MSPERVDYDSDEDYQQACEYEEWAEMQYRAEMQAQYERDMQEQYEAHMAEMEAEYEAEKKARDYAARGDITSPEEQSDD